MSTGRDAVDHEYTSALGRAVFAFARLEANAIWCCELLRPGSIAELENRTAGRVADTLRSLVGDMAASASRDALDSAAADFQAFVSTRNNLLHARPAQDEHGAPVLMRDGDPWRIAEMDAVTAAFTVCADRLANLIRPDSA